MPIAAATTAPPVARATPLFATSALRQADRRASERHRVPSILLMDRASLEAARLIATAYPDRHEALVVCGSGNNGGDGYAVARHLADLGWTVEIAVPRGQTPRTPDAMTMATAAKGVGLRPRPFTPALLDSPRLVVDALLGIGGRGGPREPVAAIVNAVSASGVPVVALDVPSGVDADTGEIAGVAIRAELTVTFHGDKQGLRIEPGRAHAGRVVVVDIGIPAVVGSVPSAWLAGEDAGDVPPKPQSTDKYGAGAVLVVAGSPGLSGAGILCARATLRAGAGLTVAAVPRGVQPVYASTLVEVMAAPIVDVDGCFGAGSVDEVVEQAHRVGAIAIGPGLGRHPQTTGFVQAILEAIELPAVIDADGLWHLGRRPSWLARRAAPTVITPHAGEAARLLGVGRDEIEAGRLRAARRLADATGAVAVLKGPGTLVVDREGTVVVDAGGTSALASAGSGDVLTGIVATFLAKGMPAVVAAATAVAVHGRAGRLAHRGDGTVAGDLVEHLPEAIAP